MLLNPTGQGVIGRRDLTVWAVVHGGGHETARKFDADNVTFASHGSRGWNARLDIAGGLFVDHVVKDHQRRGGRRNPKLAEIGHHFPEAASDGLTRLLKAGADPESGDRLWFRSGNCHFVRHDALLSFDECFEKGKGPLLLSESLHEPAAMLVEQLASDIG